MGVYVDAVDRMGGPIGYIDVIAGLWGPPQSRALVLTTCNLSERIRGNEGVVDAQC